MRITKRQLRKIISEAIKFAGDDFTDDFDDPNLEKGVQAFVTAFEKQDVEYMISNLALLEMAMLAVSERDAIEFTRLLVQTIPDLLSRKMLKKEPAIYEDVAVPLWELLKEISSEHPRIAQYTIPYLVEKLQRQYKNKANIIYGNDYGYDIKVIARFLGEEETAPVWTLKLNLEHKNSPREKFMCAPPPGKEEWAQKERNLYGKPDTHPSAREYFLSRLDTSEKVDTQYDRTYRLMRDGVGCDDEKKYFTKEQAIAHAEQWVKLGHWWENEYREFQGVIAEDYDWYRYEMDDENLTIVVYV